MTLEIFMCISNLQYTYLDLNLKNVPIYKVLYKETQFEQTDTY